MALIRCTSTCTISRKKTCQALYGRKGGLSGYLSWIACSRSIDDIFCKIDGPMYGMKPGGFYMSLYVLPVHYRYRRLKLHVCYGSMSMCMTWR